MLARPLRRGLAAWRTSGQAGLASRVASFTGVAAAPLPQAPRRSCDAAAPAQQGLSSHCPNRDFVEQQRGVPPQKVEVGLCKLRRARAAVRRQIRTQVQERYHRGKLVRGNQLRMYNWKFRWPRAVHRLLSKKAQPKFSCVLVLESNAHFRQNFSKNLQVASSLSRRKDLVWLGWRKVWQPNEMKWRQLHHELVEGSKALFLGEKLWRYCGRSCKTLSRYAAVWALRLVAVESYEGEYSKTRTVAVRNSKAHIGQCGSEAWRDQAKRAEAILSDVL